MTQNMFTNFEKLPVCGSYCKKDSDLDGLPSHAMTQNMFTNFEKLPVCGSYCKKDSDLDGLPSHAMTQNMFTNFEKLPVCGSYCKSHVFYIRYRVFGSRRQINKGLFRC